MRKGFRLKGYLAAFVIVVPILLTTALISSPCPVCGGSGQVSGNDGAEKVSIVDSEFVAKRVLVDTCGVYIVFPYLANMSALNEGDKPVDVWFMMQLIDTTKKEGQNLIDTQYIQFPIPAKSVVTNSFKVTFGTGLDEPGNTKVLVSVLPGGIPCEVCNGTGKIPSNTWPFVNALKASLKENVRTVSAYHPPLAIDWSDYVFFDE